MYAHRVIFSPTQRKMISEYFISIVLDQRRKNKTGKFPARLRVYTPSPRKQKLYPLPFSFTKDEFAKVWHTRNPKAQEDKEIKFRLQKIENEANELARTLSLFSIEAFERKFIHKVSIGQMDVNSYYESAISQYMKNNQIGTASNYKYSLKSLLEFHSKERLHFSQIDDQWLKEFECHLVSKGKSLTTVGIYLRPLRAIFNSAIEDGTIQQDTYPFGKRKYTIPTPQGRKKALSEVQLRLLYHSTPSTPEQQKAKDFWFFSYACNGMNFKDIAKLQYKNISGDSLTFIRAKTANTNKHQAPVVVYLDDFTNSVINKYGNSNVNPETLIFSIVEQGASAVKQHAQLKNFIRYVNQHIKKLAKDNGLSDDLSTYTARHSWATKAIREGASLEFVSEALSHSDLKTTIGYFAGFEDDKKREISNKMMDF